MTSTLLPESLYQKCLDCLRKSRDLDFVVKDSMPIPYFGDIEAFLGSPKKIVTAALNPSNVEFVNRCGARFDVAAGLADAAGLEATLSHYFKCNPYSKWFRSFEPVLNGLGASYRGKISNAGYPATALHLDLCTPIATHPTWSRLTKEMQEELLGDGQQIFCELIDALKPDMIIASVGEKHIRPLHDIFAENSSWEEVVIFRNTQSGAPFRAPLRVKKRAMRPMESHRPLFINGTAANTPFGRFSTERKFEVGSILQRFLS